MRHKISQPVLIRYTLEELNNYNFSSFAKSMLNRFLPCFPANCTSRNSVSFNISLLRTMPSPNLSCRTRSPALYCCIFGSTGSGARDICSLCDSGDVTSLVFVCDNGGTVGDE